jgi:CRISPR-associated protein Cas1
MQKIKNQALCMKICGYVQAESLYKLAEIVQSGDKTNVEGRAAAMYFKILFGRNFTRSFNNVTNACLNYGYAILRGIIAKNLAIYGFEPCIGIFHHSELNNFNLADDLIESYRPVIDLFVAQNVNEDCVSFDTTTKYSIFNLLNTSINIDEQQHSVFYAIEKTVQSLSACFLYKKEELVLPTLIPLKIHEYE